MTTRQIARAGCADWAAVKDTRLRALADAPYAFAATLAQERDHTDAQWQQRVAQIDWFLARADGRPIGIVAAVIDTLPAPEGHLLALWVEPAHRGTATATDLVEAACAWVGAAGARTVMLWLADGNPGARKLYHRLGFEPTGDRQPLPSAPEVSEQRLRRVLPARAPAQRPA